VHNVDVLFFFFLVLVVGISSGVIENFAYVRMREVGGSGKEMGLSRLVSSLAGAPMFWFSGTLTEALGADRVIVLSLVSYVVRFLIYAFMQNAYHGLPAEALRGVTFAAFWSTGTIYAHRVSPPGLHATMLMFLNAMYGGLGQSLGAVIGGELQHRYGTVQTFLYAAAFDLVFVTLVVTYLCLRKESSFKDPKPIVAKDKKKTP
jgi:MFS transporter, PPP family, 3-phenylpropionic acid transporter